MNFDLIYFYTCFITNNKYSKITEIWLRSSKNYDKYGSLLFDIMFKK